MCIAIHKPAGKKLHEFVYRNCFSRNDDGAGFAYVADGKMVIEKGIMKEDEFVKAVQAVEDNEMIIHCRLMSKGEVCKDNCHPFHAESEIFPNFEFAVIHNGTLNWRSTKERSDTSFFMEDAIKPIIDRDPWFFKYSLQRAMMGAYVGSNNKMLVMMYDKEKNEVGVYGINKGEGIEYNGCWFSNLSFTDDQSRYIIAADRERIKHWEPALFHEVVYTPPVYTGNQQNLPWKQEERFPSVKRPGAPDEWVFVKGFGYYNKNPNYHGGRCLEDYNKWKLGQAPAPGGADPVGSPTRKDGEFDPMEYLSQKEFKRVRGICVDIMKAVYPDFDFKGITTMEVAAWARGEIRSNFNDLKDMTNVQLMRLILSGSIL